MFNFFKRKTIQKVKKLYTITETTTYKTIRNVIDTLEPLIDFEAAFGDIEHHLHLTVTQYNQLAKFCCKHDNTKYFPRSAKQCANAHAKIGGFYITVLPS